MDLDETGDGATFDLKEHGRPGPPLVGGETMMLLAFLDYHRATFAWKGRNLSSEDLHTTTAASTMTLVGMIKHLALVEDWWFSRSP
jgi:hypothetical protein